MKAVSYTVAELVERGSSKLPDELRSDRHLIYSSPAALAFNSPGAEGFGVKRAGLSIPGSVMLVVAPGCCGRNTSLVSRLPGYANRFFYYSLSQTDIVTGGHLRLIPQAVREVVESLERCPSVVMVCITCVDALLGTDMERVCRACEREAGVPVRPCYMYALTREGSRPPMVHVRQSLYSLLEPRAKDPRAVNILGFFAPLMEDCELFGLLRGMGVRQIRQISTCADFDEYLAMAKANFNLVLHPEARAAALDLEKRLGIPFVELARLHRPEKIHSQYQALAAALGVELDDTDEYERTRTEVDTFRVAHPGLTFAVGECLNANAFELAAALLAEGFGVSEIFGTVTSDSYVYLRRIASMSPGTRVYSNLEPTMLFYGCAGSGVDVTLGKDALYYAPDVPNLLWNEDVQPFGYAGVRKLYRELDRVLSKEDAGTLDARGAHVERVTMSLHGVPAEEGAAA